MWTKTLQNKFDTQTQETHKQRENREQRFDIGMCNSSFKHYRHYNIHSTATSEYYEAALTFVFPKQGYRT